MERGVLYCTPRQGFKNFALVDWKHLPLLYRTCWAFENAQRPSFGCVTVCGVSLGHRYTCLLAENKKDRFAFSVVCLNFYVHPLYEVIPLKKCTNRKQYLIIASGIVFVLSRCPSTEPSLLSTLDIHRFLGHANKARENLNILKFWVQVLYLMKCSM